ncbi:hypothetical protein [Streptomyces sp. NPDC058247]|uniref:hypothetical protein n=1 Tax=Streptomyces sp. NPDC058247 TaxID=3346401 RepID=UPI0036EE95B0
MSDSKAITPTRVYPAGIPLPPEEADNDPADRIDWHSVIPPSAPDAEAPQPTPLAGQRASVLAGVGKVADALTSNDDASEGQDDAEPKGKKPKKAKGKNGKGAKVEPDPEGSEDETGDESDDEGQDDAEPKGKKDKGPKAGTDDEGGDVEADATRTRQFMKALRKLDNLSDRRWIAARYAVGAGIGYGFGLPQWGLDQLHAIHAAPGPGLCNFIAVAVMPHSFYVLAKLTRGLGGLLSWLASVTGAAAAGTFLSGYGYAFTEYAASHGIDPATVAPLAVGTLAVVGCWWFIDRHTARWAERHWPGRVLHWALSAPTSSAAAALAFYLPNL